MESETLRAMADWVRGESPVDERIVENALWYGTERLIREGHQFAYTDLRKRGGGSGWTWRCKGGSGGDGTLYPTLAAAVEAAFKHETRAGKEK